MVFVHESGSGRDLLVPSTKNFICTGCMGGSGCPVVNIMNFSSSEIIKIVKKHFLKENPS